MIENNSNIFGDVDPDYADDVSPKNTEYTSANLRSSFFAWHRPRKQWIRSEQWVATIEGLIDKLKLAENSEPLHYFSLPGPDLLDVRTLLPICESKNVKLKFLGLNAGGDDRPEDLADNVALLSQVTDDENVDKNSKIVEDRFEHLAKKNSIAHQRVISDRSTYDVVNLDFCGSIADGPVGVGGDTISNAIWSLLENQALYCRQDWIFFITTRADRLAVNASIMGKFIDKINENIEKDPELLSCLLDLDLIKNSDVNHGFIDINNVNDESHANIYSVGLGLWIVNKLISSVPAWRVDMMPQYGYHVTFKNETCDMLSLGFYCKRIMPTSQPDVFNIAVRPAGGCQSDSVPVVLKKCEQRVYRRVSERKNLDVHLFFNKDEYSRSLDASARLLHGARYDVGKYRSWAIEDNARVEMFLKEYSLVP